MPIARARFPSGAGSLPAVLLALALLAGSRGIGRAEEPAAETSACLAADWIEADGRGAVQQAIAEIDDAAGSGDTMGFCLASDALVAVYEQTATSVLACSDERAARWNAAAEQTRASTQAVCR
ncbi:hypothetical protein ASG43_20325 [Aureimonas sp. Leaf454]|nr:hypothetical protein ASG43_20325 [Aureimonas sp. Leaf454]